MYKSCIVHTNILNSVMLYIEFSVFFISNQDVVFEFYVIIYVELVLGVVAFSLQIMNVFK